MMKLKYILSVGLLTLIGLINFGYCDYILNSFDSIVFSGRQYKGNRTYSTGLSDLGLSIGDYVCLSGGFTYRAVDVGNLYMTFFRALNIEPNANGGILSFLNKEIISGTDLPHFECMKYTNSQSYFIIKANCAYTYCNWSFSYDIYTLKSTANGCPTCPTIDQNYCTSNNLCPSLDYSGYVLEEDITEGYCTGKYSNLIPEDSIDSAYCVSNELCPESELSGNWSSIFINDVQHVGASLIDITIPEEISWDYTNENDVFSLDVEGYNQDSDYILGVINTQSLKPDKTDLNNIITGLIPLFVPGLVIILFLYFIFKFIKKIF